MTTPKTPRRGRPAIWYNRVEAPREAIELYRMIANLQYSTAFDACHIYKGTSSKPEGVPLFKWHSQVTSLPYVICSYMGLDYGKRRCTTPGCMNPFHYVAPSELNVPPDRTFMMPPQIVSMDEWLDLIAYYTEERGVKRDFEALRAAIPEEDLSTENLKTALSGKQGEADV